MDRHVAAYAVSSPYEQARRWQFEICQVDRMFDAGYERLRADHPNAKIVSTCASWHLKQILNSPVALCTTWGPPKTAPGGVNDTSGILRSPYMEMHEGDPSELKSPSCTAHSLMGDASTLCGSGESLDGLACFDMEGMADGGAAPNSRLSKLDGGAGPELKEALVVDWVANKLIPMWRSGVAVVGAEGSQELTAIKGELKVHGGHYPSHELLSLDLACLHGTLDFVSLMLTCARFSLLASRLSLLASRSGSDISCSRATPAWLSRSTRTMGARQRSLRKRRARSGCSVAGGSSSASRRTRTRPAGGLPSRRPEALQSESEGRERAHFHRVVASPQHRVTKNAIIKVLD